MALVEKTLSTNLYNHFKNVSSDDDFANKLVSDIESYLKTATSQIMYTGAITLGAIVSGMGSIVSINTSSSKPIFVNGVKLMNKTMSKMEKGGDTYMVTQLSTLISTFINTSIVKASATLVWSMGMATGTISGTASGTMISNPTILMSGLPSVFNSMKKMSKSKDGNQYFGEKLANLLTNTIKASPLTVYGEGLIIGAIGTGTVS